MPGPAAAPGGRPARGRRDSLLAERTTVCLPPASRIQCQGGIVPLAGGDALVKGPQPHHGRAGQLPVQCGLACTSAISMRATLRKVLICTPVRAGRSEGWMTIT